MDDFAKNLKYENIYLTVFLKLFPLKLETLSKSSYFSFFGGVFWSKFFKNSITNQKLNFVGFFQINSSVIRLFSLQWLIVPSFSEMYVNLLLL